MLVDSAMQLLSPSIPEISVQERRDALARASKFALMQGVTTVVDMGRYLPGVSPELSWEDLSGWVIESFIINCLVSGVMPYVDILYTSLHTFPSNLSVRGRCLRVGGFWWKNDDQSMPIFSYGDMAPFNCKYSKQSCHISRSHFSKVIT